MPCQTTIKQKSPDKKPYSNTQRVPKEPLQKRPKEPTFYQKSPTSHQKSPAFCERSPTFCEKSPDKKLHSNTQRAPKEPLQNNPHNLSTIIISKKVSLSEEKNPTKKNPATKHC